MATAERNKSLEIRPSVEDRTDVKSVRDADNARRVLEWSRVVRDDMMTMRKEILRAAFLTMGA